VFTQETGGQTAEEHHALEEALEYRREFADRNGS
jgi:hypothetical protein